MILQAPKYCDVWPLELNPPAADPPSHVYSGWTSQDCVPSTKHKIARRRSGGVHIFAARPWVNIQLKRTDIVAVCSNLEGACTRQRPRPCILVALLYTGFP